MDNRMTAKTPVQAKTAQCPDCGEQIPVRLPIEMGQRVLCPICQADLEVVEMVPLELDWLYEDPPDLDVEEW